MKKNSDQPKNKSEFNRELINEHIPYELIALATLRYYAALQESGQLDIVEHMMNIERITEQEAIDKCMSIFKAVSEKQSKFSQLYIDLTSPDNLSELFDEFQKN
ncbi:MAG: hypothetical protein ACRBFS_17945 [Aureispira sp.]